MKINWNGKGMKIAAMITAIISGELAAVFGCITMAFGVVPELAGGHDKAVAALTSEMYYMVYTRTGVGALPKVENSYRTLAEQIVSYRNVYGIVLLLALIVWVLALYALCKAAGRKKDGQLLACPIDRIPFGLYVLGVCGICALLFALQLGMMDLFNQRAALSFCLTVILLAAALMQLFVYWCLMSIAVRIKTKSFWRNTVLHYVLVPVRYLLRALRECMQRLPLFIKTFCVFFVVSFAEFLVLYRRAYYFYTGSILEPFFLWKCAQAVFLILLLRQFARLRAGGERIARGDYTHPIETRGLWRECRRHADNLNNVQTGVAAAVEEKMKSERLRTELITNVSHDIKTPLTSIINYVDLIKKEPQENERMQEYVEVLDRQSARLKKLIEDLMEASKASSGSMPVEPAVCDATVMLTQVVGEYEERTKEKELDIVVESIEPPANIYVDGRHLWRIIDNLMSNICKYAMQGTRVYINLERCGSMIILTFRNISRDRLRMDSEELFGRFVRGDSSRNMEGNGLGLSIAKSLTELMHGNLAVQIDGDLFKVILSFEEWTA